MLVKISIETRPRSFHLKINKKKALSLSDFVKSYDQFYCVNGTGVDEEDGVGDEDRKKALVIIYKKHSPFFTCNQPTKQPTYFNKEKNSDKCTHMDTGMDNCAITESDDL